jgi:hypothetical protein
MGSRSVLLFVAVAGFACGTDKPGAESSADSGLNAITCTPNPHIGGGLGMGDGGGLIQTILQFEMFSDGSSYEIACTCINASPGTCDCYKNGVGSSPVSGSCDAVAGAPWAVCGFPQ